MLALKSLASLTSLALLAQSTAATEYKVIDLGVLSGQSNSVGYGLNDLGWAVGRSNSGSGQGFLWRPGLPLSQVGPWPTWAGQSESRGVNNSGQTCGFHYDPFFNKRAFVTRPGGFGPRLLGTLPGGDSSEAYDVNEGGTVVGDAYSPVAHTLRAFRWTVQNGMVDLGNLFGIARGSNAFAVNGPGWIVGTSSTEDLFAEACLWKPDGSIVDLGKHAGYQHSFAMGINDAGTVVGYSITVGLPSRAFLWKSKSGFVDLGIDPQIGTEAWDINSHEEVVGTSAFFGGTSIIVWTAATGWIDIQDHLEPGSQSWNLNAARRINENGEIVGAGSNGHGARAIKLVPLK